MDCSENTDANPFRIINFHGVNCRRARSIGTSGETGSEKSIFRVEQILYFQVQAAFVSLNLAICYSMLKDKSYVKRNHTSNGVNCRNQGSVCQIFKMCSFILL
jgi:hypothetical protein